VVANLVKLHDGTVTALSAGRGHGSTFTIDLPLSEIPAIAAQAAIPPESRRRGAGALRVLVVDDNSDAADTLADALAALGCDSRVAHDGAEAIRIAAEYEPQVALLDIGLPVMDGYELAARLRDAPREAPRGEQLRLVAVTGYGQDSDGRRAFEACFDAHLVKPVDLRVIADLINGYRTGLEKRSS